MTTSFYSDHGGKLEGSTVTMNDDFDMTDLPPEKAGTALDRRDMARMGKVQEMRRNFSFIPIFGFAAVLMITWEAVFNSASYVLINGGLAGMVWMYMVTFFGFGAAILAMAEMASMAPTSGGQYHWVSEFAPKSYQKIMSYIVGWYCVLGWQAGIAGQCTTVALQIIGMISLNNDSYVPQAWHIVLLTIADITIAVVFNSFFARKLPLVEGLVLVLHVCGFFAILIPLWVFAPRHSSLDVWTNFSQAQELPAPSQPWPSIGLACLVGLSSSIYALIGPDSCVHMAEEVKDASRTIPWAMVSTLIFNGFTGLIMVVTFAYCLGPLDVARNAPYGFAFISTFYNATGSKAGATVMTAIITILSMCSAISNVATASRQMFAFARDHGLPFGRYLAYVRPGWDIPVNAVCVSFCITSLLSLINLGSANAFNAILSIGVVALLTSYLASMSCILIKRIRGEELLPRRWSLGKNFGIVCNSIGLAYIGLAFIFAFFPLSNTPNASAMNWASAVYGGVGLLAAGWYVISARHTYIPPVSRLMKDL